MTSLLLINLAPQKGSAYMHGDLQLILKVTKANCKLYPAYRRMQRRSLVMRDKRTNLLSCKHPHNILTDPFRSQAADVREYQCNQVRPSIHPSERVMTPSILPPGIVHSRVACNLFRRHPSYIVGITGLFMCCFDRARGRRGHDVASRGQRERQNIGCVRWQVILR